MTPPTTTCIPSGFIFFAAVGAFFGGNESLLDLIRSSPDAAHIEGLLTLLINRLCGCEDSYIVLDDVHCIREPALIRALEFFIGAMPSNFHIFMLSREDPPLYLGPLAMSGRLLYLGGKDMQLTPEEGVAFLKDTLKFSGSNEDLSKLAAYADGWIGGLQLAAAAGAGADDSRFGQLLRAGGGIAAEYLSRELFESLTPIERDFLMGTSFVSYFNADLCAALFDGLTKTDFERLIDTLVAKNLFIVCVDEKEGVYRYHNILSEYLTHRFLCLPEEEKRRQYLKAAAAFEKLGDREEALREFSAAKDYDDVLRVAHSMGGRLEAWSYLDQVPVEVLIRDVDLAAQSFIYNIGSLNVDRCRALFEAFRAHYGDSDVFKAIQFAEVYISTGDATLPQYQVLNADGRLSTSPSAPWPRRSCWLKIRRRSLGGCSMRKRKGVFNWRSGSAAGTNVFVDFFAYNQLAQVYEETGCLVESLSCYDKSKELLKSPLMLSGVGTNYYFGLVGVYMRRMELDKAAETLTQVRALMDEQPYRVNITDMTLAYHEAEMKFLSGDDEAGLSYVEGILSRVFVLQRADAGTPHPRARLRGQASRGDSRRVSERNWIPRVSIKINPSCGFCGLGFFLKRGETEEALRETEDVLVFSRLQNNKLHLVGAGLLKIWMLNGHAEKPNDHS